MLPVPPASRGGREHTRCTQQQARALRTIEPLVPRHGHKGRPQPLQRDRQAAGGLGRVQHKGYAFPPAQGGQLLHRQHKAEHIGHMGAYDRLCLRLQGLVEGVQLGLPVKERCPGWDHLRAQGVERAGDCIVLPTRDHHPVPRPYQGPNGQVEPVGGIEGEYHAPRVRDAEEVRRRLTAAERRLCRPHGRRVAAAAGGGQVAHGPCCRPGDRRRLLQGGGRAVQIDHSCTSR